MHKQPLRILLLALLCAVPVALSPVLANSAVPPDSPSPAFLYQNRQALSIVSIDIMPVTARVNQRVAITVSVRNDSDIEQTERLIMRLNGETVSDQQVTLPPMETSIFNFAYFPTNTGKHTVTFLLAFSQKTATFEAIPPVILGSPMARHILAIIALLLMVGFVGLVIARRQALVRKSSP